MHHAAVAGPDLHGFHPFVLSEMRRHRDVLIVDDALGRHVERLRHFENHVRLGDPPAFGELHRLRRIRGISFRRSAVDPCHQRLLLAGRQRKIVGELAVMRIGLPRRHLAAQQRSTIALAHGRACCVSEQRHRRSFARAMAALAALFQNGLNVFVKGGRRSGGKQRKRKWQRKNAQSFCHVKPRIEHDT